MMASKITLMGWRDYGPFIVNVILGVIFGVLFLRWQRVNPMIIAHALINSVAFIGYTLLAGQVSWLP
jgi:membrane protease YdiL (CAAX protease family)